MWGNGFLLLLLFFCVFFVCVCVFKRERESMCVCVLLLLLLLTAGIVPFAHACVSREDRLELVAEGAHLVQVLAAA